LNGQWKKENFTFYNQDRLQHYDDHKNSNKICKRVIFTDIGGITSHAAIISREFRIPCIIGTKIATKILKDGDLVEVDANKGVVKIIKKVGKIN
jgi:phosphohistidine swiveling domain-containing protein